MSHYVHSIPGRLRVKARAFKKQPENADAARALLAGIEGVLSVEANLTTGSLLIRYDNNVLQSSHILGALVANGMIQHPTLPRPVPQPARPAIAGNWRRVMGNLSEALPDLIADVIADKLAQRAAAALVRAVI